MKEYCFYHPEKEEDKNRWEKFSAYYIKCLKENGTFVMKRDIEEACQVSGYSKNTIKNLLQKVIIPTTKRNGYILTEKGTFIDPNESDYSL
jgi:Mn-dependent DtxR family transcriptional regulator